MATCVHEVQRIPNRMIPKNITNYKKFVKSRTKIVLKAAGRKENRHI
jgi:hypothetical protein